MAETIAPPARRVDDVPGEVRPPLSRLSRPALVAVVVAVGIGLALRLWIMTGRLGAIDSDEAITGLMARHLLDGEFRAFMWRLSYQGTIATYPVAASFAVLGTSRFALELPYLLMSVAATLCLWRIATRFMPPFRAASAALAFWLWPALYVWISVKPLLFYVPTLLLGVAAILGALRAVEQRTRWLDWALAGLLAGAGWWTSPNIMYFVVPAGLFLVAFHWRSLWPRALVTVPFAGVGALPWIWNDITYGFDSLEVQYGAQGSYFEHLRYFFTHALPAALGIRAPFTGSWAMGALGVSLYVVALALLVTVVVRGLRERSFLAFGLLSLPFLFALVPVASNLDTDFIGNGRYFYFFTPFLALAVGRLARPVAPAVALTVLLAVSTAWGFVRIYDFRDAIGGGPPLDDVIAVLERLGHREVFASFWVSARLTFESEERIIAVATDLGPTLQAYEDRVRSAARPVYVTTLNEGPFNPLADLRERARAQGITLREIRVGEYLILEPSARMIPPPPFDLSSRP